MDRIHTTATLLRMGLQRHFRPFLILLLVLMALGFLMALGASYPILAPFLYSVF